MHESMKVQSDVPKNRLVIQLRGYFMKSEIELAFYLAKKEVKKLSSGFVVIMDIDGMYTDKDLNNNILSKARDVLGAMGASEIVYSGVLAHLPNLKYAEIEEFTLVNVGIYPN